MSDRQEGIISHLVLILTSRFLQKDKNSSGKSFQTLSFVIFDCMIYNKYDIFFFLVKYIVEFMIYSGIPLLV
jgi:hypothetical protein